jgi:hypothetical protein
VLAAQALNAFHEEMMRLLSHADAFWQDDALGFGPRPQISRGSEHSRNALVLADRHGSKCQGLLKRANLLRAPALDVQRGDCSNRLHPGRFISVLRFRVHTATTRFISS